jgi:hypothetical protein
MRPLTCMPYSTTMQVSLFQLFDSSDYKFDIPTYQRPYAWRTKQIYELLQVGSWHSHCALLTLMRLE